MVDTEWRPVPGFEGHYEIDRAGTVRGVDRMVGGRWGSRPWKGRTLRPGTAGNGYLTVMLRRAGKGRSRYIHDLMLETWVGPRPDGQWACHRNGVATDNRLENLRWGTPGSRLPDMHARGTHPSQVKPRCKYGHPFSEANTTAASRSAGAHRCVACARAYAAVRNARVSLQRAAARGAVIPTPRALLVDHQALADEYFAALAGQRS